MKLLKIAQHPVVALNPGDTLNHAMQQMWRRNIEHLPVVDHGRPVGIVAERDLLYHACGDSYAAHELTHKHFKHVFGTSRVDDIMSSPIVSLSPEAPVETAARLMLSEEIHAILLVTRDSVVGIVTETDILKCFLDENSLLLGDRLKTSSIVDHMIAHVFSVKPADLRPAVIRLMRDKQIRYVPVVDDDGELAGVVTETDVLLGAKLNGVDTRTVPAMSACAMDIMSNPAETLDLASTIKDAARIMVGNNTRCVPVVEDRKLVGIATSTDLVRAFVHACE